MPVTNTEVMLETEAKGKNDPVVTKKSLSLSLVILVIIFFFNQQNFLLVFPPS